MGQEAKVTLGCFEKYIYLWIALCAIAGLLFGRLFPQLIHDLNSLNVGGVSIPIAFLMFFLMYPTMAKVKLEELSHAVKNIGPSMLTLIANWVIAPPLMVLLATLFLGNPEFRAGTILLGISPCTGMVLFWIAFARGNVAQGVVITAINAVSTLLLYAPLTAFYLGVGGVPVPFSLVVHSVLLFVALPLFVGQVSRRLLISNKGVPWFANRFLPVMDTLATASLLGMLVLLFSSEGKIILEYPLTVALIAVPILLHFELPPVFRLPTGGFHATSFSSC
ncbi:MAG: bile acid:sodium symporter [Sulfuricella sp.]|nr:bile acid:sodium symporter [Sulfuricella sp.]